MILADLMHNENGTHTTTGHFWQSNGVNIEKWIGEAFGLNKIEISQVVIQLKVTIGKLWEPEKSIAQADLWQQINLFFQKDWPTIKQQMSQNFSLTPAGFQELITYLQQGDDRLFEQVFLSHFNACKRYLQNQYGATAENAHDAAMDAMLSFCERLTQGKIQYGNLRFLFTQMASHIYLRWIKKEKRYTAFNEIDSPEKPVVFSRELLNLLDKVWETLCEDCQQLLRDNYHNNLKLNEIAALLEKSHSAVRKQKQRCIEKLRDGFRKYYTF